MNTLVIVLIAIVVLGAGYVLYGRHIAKSWGIDPKAETPAVKYNDGKDFVPTNGWTVFSHQFSSIAGAGPVTGAIQAAVFGWVPVLLWVLIGGVFFGAVTDFGALYASVKNEGKSMGMLIEKYIGKLGRKLFTIFCWLFSVLIIAVFADMVTGTFSAFDAETLQKLPTAGVNGSAGMVSIMFMVFAVVFGLIQKKWNLTGWKEFVVGVVFIVASFAVGIKVPIIMGKTQWAAVVFAYIFLAAIMPIWLMKQPRDYMTTIMFVCMIAGAIIGLVIGHPTMELPAFTGFNNEKLGTMFPILFVTVACGAVSGFHSLVSSGTSSKTIANEKDMLKVGYGAMILESVLAVLALCVAGAAAKNGVAAEGTPFQIFSRGVAGFFEKMGVPVQVATVFMTMCVSALALTTLDAVARIGKMSFQEIFSVDDMQHAALWRKVVCNPYFHYPALRLCAHQGGLPADLASVWLCQPVAQRTGADYAVRVPEGYRQKEQDPVPAYDHYAVRYLYCIGAAADRHDQGHSAGCRSGDPCRTDQLGRCVYCQRFAADHRRAADCTWLDHCGQQCQELCEEQKRQRDRRGRQGITACV